MTRRTPHPPKSQLVPGRHGGQLVVEPLRVDCLLDILVEEEIPEDDLSDIAGDPGAAGGPGDEPDIPFPVDDDGRDHGREGSLPGDGEVVGGGWNAEAVGDAGIGKVVHLVVHYDTRGGREDLGAKTEDG